MDNFVKRLEHVMDVSAIEVKYYYYYQEIFHQLPSSHFRFVSIGPALIDEKKALSFLHTQAIRSKRSRTNAVEECCMEGCQYEEIHEYC